MNKVFTFLTLCLATIAAAAQSKADIEVSYTVHQPSFRDGKTDLTKQVILLTNAAESKFFSPITEYIDSLKSTPEGRAKLNEMTKEALSAGKYDDIPSPDGTTYIVKSFATGVLKHYDTAGTEKFVYEEPINTWNWGIGDSTKVILGYECVMATTDYHGRKWTAWFAPEIPVQNGPWKLDGLPGLILEATAEGGQYSFIATGIQQTDKAIRPIYLAHEYEMTTRLKYLKSRRAFMDNPLGEINARFGSEGKTVITGDDGTNIDEADIVNMFVPASVADFLETDYK